MSTTKTTLTIVEIYSGIWMVYENNKPVADDEKFLNHGAAVNEARRRAASVWRNATFAE